MGYIMDLRKVLGSRPLILTGAGVIVINEKDEILMQKRRDNGFWDFPAGSMELGESFEETARREVLEETGLVCGKLDFLTTLSGKEFFYEYPNGDQGYAAGIIFICFDYSGTMKVQEEEVFEQRFFALDDLPSAIDPRKRPLYDKVREYLRKEGKFQ